ncbi:MAG: LTA synthase family protein [Lewinellaceae bacterium]|nr:LTA synthase family protein [Lewinellaceae bacterium]
MPIMMLQHPMYNGTSEFAQFSGLPVTLKEKGYQTVFFCTHPKTFDNLDVFLKKNAFDIISDVEDYPEEQIVSSWGVSDESLYAHAMQTMDSLANNPQQKPFFSTILTISSHPPYTLPDSSAFRSTTQDPVLRSFEYADWAVHNFIDSCATKPWYQNTIFVLVGDHGVNLPTPYDVPCPTIMFH